jgi:hypothetical protein
MGLAPRLDSLHVKRAAKVVAVGPLVQPASLTGRLAGLLAGWLGTVTLAVVIAIIREEELAATAALALFGSDTHCSRKEHQIQARKSKTTHTEEQTKEKKEEEL